MVLTALGSAADEIAFNDSGVAEIDTLRRALRPSVAAHILNPGQHAPVRIHDVLRGRDDVAAVRPQPTGRRGLRHGRFDARANSRAVPSWSTTFNGVSGYQPGDDLMVDTSGYRGTASNANII